MTNDDFTIMEVNVISALVRDEIYKEIKVAREASLNEPGHFFNGYIKGLQKAEYIVATVCDRIKKPIVDAIVDYIMQQPCVICSKADYERVKVDYSGDKQAQVFGIEGIPQGTLYISPSYQDFIAKEDKDAE